MGEGDGWSLSKCVCVESVTAGQIFIAFGAQFVSNHQRDLMNLKKNDEFIVVPRANAIDSSV